MSVTGTPVTGITETAKWRTWRVNIETPRGATDNDSSKYRIQVYRERWLFDQNNAVIGQPVRMADIDLPSAAVEAQTFTIRAVPGVGDLVLTGAQLEFILANVFDQIATGAGVDK